MLVDGAPDPGRHGIAGIGAVVCTPRGRVLTWRYTDRPALTSMEAEYQAVIAGLELMLQRYPGARVRCLSDCRVVVEQMSGRYAVRAAGLKPLHAQATALARRLVQVEFIAIPRELNRLADALAGFRTTHGRVDQRLGHDTPHAGDAGTTPDDG